MPPVTTSAILRTARANEAALKPLGKAIDIRPAPFSVFDPINTIALLLVFAATIYCFALAL